MTQFWRRELVCAPRQTGTKNFPIQVPRKNTIVRTASAERHLRDPPAPASLCKSYCHQTRNDHQATSRRPPTMSAPDTPVNSSARELFDEMSRWPIYDPHTHIDPRRPAARHFDEILGYHYYTELAHSTGMPAQLVSPDLDPTTRVQNLVEYLDRIDSTVQYSWLLEIARTFHRFPHDRITPKNIGELLDRSNHERDGAEWDREVWKTSKLEAVFLTNEFDDTLDGWDTAAYVPCLRTDDLVLKLHDPQDDRPFAGRGRCRRSGLGKLEGGHRPVVRAIRQTRGQGLRDQLAAGFRTPPRVAAASGHTRSQGDSRDGSPSR